MASRRLSQQLKQFFGGKSDSCDALCDPSTSGAGESYGTFNVVEDGVEHPGIGGLFIRISNELRHHHYHQLQALVRYLNYLFLENK